MKPDNSVPDDYAPSDDEEFMSERQKAYFKARLHSWKDELMADSKFTIEGMKEEAGNIPDIADRASEETSRAVLLRTRDRQRKLVAKIDQALLRIENGDFGYCQETGQPISLQRLIARPIATLCLEAQERHERDERVFRDD
ncbi:MAG: RNA polymerase-binding protein DksA [Albidovulum sp.]|nr:RNA polymerase-binding protein DksA [Albidovulum sp.]MDE0306081.1 RNA polymerase-binding protein DksA [Albidovulum sp.]MDE0531278.1 RNA polymerase-binding protein DksA [Albidovulum sp.]